MLNGRRRWLALGALAAALAVGAGAALAASGAADDSFLGGVAKRLGITEDKLKDAIRDEQIARIDQAVQDGDLTQAEGERLKERVRSGEQPGLFPGKPFARGFGFDFGFDIAGPVLRGVDNQLKTAADYLGLTQAQLRDELSDGDSLADVARQKGKSVDGLKAAMRAALKQDLDKAVADGNLTRTQADDLYEKLSGGIDTIVEKGLPFSGRLGRGFGFGFGLGKAFGAATDLYAAAADYLGLTEAQLRDELDDGDSLGDVARQKGKSVDGLKTALRNAVKKDLDKAVADGDLTREQADNLSEKLSEGIDRLVDTGFRPGKLLPRGFGLGLGIAGGSQLDAAADYLGVTEAQLRERLEDGDSLAEVAQDKGKSVDGLETALKNAVKKDLDKAVENGKVTRSEADELYEDYSDNVDDVVEGNGRFGFRMRFHGPGGRMEFHLGPGAGLPMPAPADLDVEIQAGTI
jgi:lambda repressor-like predicted transcriptional regulator